MPTRGIRRRAPLAATLALAAMLAVAIGCDGGAPAPHGGTTTAPSATPKAGGTLAVAYLAQPRTLDPARAGNVTERSVATAVYEGLVRYADGPGLGGTALVPCLATEVPTAANGGISADGRTYTFNLRSGVSFQPPVNRELTALDVKYSLERMMDVAPAETRELLRGIVGTSAFLAGRDDQIQGIEAVGDATLRIRLLAKDPAFLSALASEACSVVPQEWVERWGEEFEEHPLGTGPFTFLKWIRGDGIKLARNPRYWQAARPHVDSVDYELALPAAAALEKLRSGEIDALGFGLPADALTVLTDDPASQDQLSSRSLLTGSYLVLNTTSRELQDVRVRRAVSRAVDRARLAELSAGVAEALWQYYPVDLPGHDAAASYSRYAPRKAKALLRQAGHPHGISTVFTVEKGADDPVLVKAIRADLAAVGIKTRLQTLSGEQYRRRMAKPRGFVLALATWRASVPDPGDWVRTMCGRESAPPGGSNLSHWWSARLEAERARADALTDPEARLAAYSAMQQTIADGAPYVPLTSAFQTSACSRYVEGFYLHPMYQLDLASYWKK